MQNLETGTEGVGEENKQSERGRAIKKEENKVYGDPSEGAMNSAVENQGRKTSWKRGAPELAPEPE